MGDEVRPVQNFYGITFTLNFDPALVSDQPNSVRFRLKQNTFITEPNSGTTSYSMVEEEAGTAEMTVLRQSLETTNGFGEIGTFIVVMEDIILLNEGNAHFSVGNIKMLDTEQNEYPIASSELDVEIQGNGNNGNNNLSQIRSVELRSDVQIFSQLEEEELWIEADNQNNTIEKIEIINEEDEVLVLKNIANIRKKAIINLNKYPTGNYILKIYSADGISSHLIVK